MIVFMLALVGGHDVCSLKKKSMIMMKMKKNGLIKTGKKITKKIILNFLINPFTFFYFLYLQNLEF